MATNTSLPTTADAVGWNTARVGDYIVPRNPATRERQPERGFIIAGPVTYTASALNAVVCPISDQTRVPVVLTFAEGEWQVWRDFPASSPAEPTVLERSIETVARVLTSEIAEAASDHGLCDEGVRAFKTRVNEALGFEFFPMRPPRKRANIMVSFEVDDAWQHNDRFVDQVRSTVHNQMSYHDCNATNIYVTDQGSTEL